MLTLILLPLHMSLLPLQILLLVGQLNLLASNNPLLAGLPPLLDNILLSLHINIHQNERIPDIIGFNQIIKWCVCSERWSMVYLQEHWLAFIGEHYVES